MSDRESLKGIRFPSLDHGHVILLDFMETDASVPRITNFLKLESRCLAILTGFPAAPAPPVDRCPLLHDLN